VSEGRGTAYSQNHIYCTQDITVIEGKLALLWIILASKVGSLCQNPCPNGSKPEFTIISMLLYVDVG
jgi:hypothetical protein